LRLRAARLGEPLLAATGPPPHFVLRRGCLLALRAGSGLRATPLQGKLKRP
jgi:hypothetical protein